MHLSTIYEWLDWIGSVHKTDIDLGLERIGEVAARLNLLTPTCRVITVGGTNGKGSVVAGLEAIYLAAGYRVGAFTSPYLFQHNEEVRLNGAMADDTSFCLAFEKIDSARAHVSLTPFEWHTLAALLIFAEAKLDIMILEVGLGGRLDAVNIIDADASVVASIGIDHIAWLGDTRELIAIEKAGIFRSGKPAICGDANPPTTLRAAADKIGAQFYQQGKDFHYTESADSWAWQSNNTVYDHLPRTNLLTQNMSTVLMTVTLMQSMLPVKEEAVRQGLKTVTLPGRIQVIRGPVTEIFDVSHNPAAAVVLADYLQTEPCIGKTVAVFSMLDDKDIAGTIAVMHGVIDEWYVAPLTCKRAASAEKLRRFCEAVTVSTFYESITAACQAARKHTNQGDRIVIFGSFYTVGEVMQIRRDDNDGRLAC